MASRSVASIVAQGFRMASGAALVALAGCGEENRYVAPPPPKVTVARPVQQPFTRHLEATGSTAAVNQANLVARVQGFVQEIKYRDGDLVTKGTTLFVIEPEPYQLKLRQAQATETSARASLRQAEADVERQTELQGRQVTSKVALDNATTNREAAQANLQRAEADTRLAALNDTYTRVAAPFDGIVTARQVSAGEMVGAGGTASVLATIVQLDPIYVNFTISEQQVLRIRQAAAERGAGPDDLRKVPVEVGLQTDDGFPHDGFLDYASPLVTASTGTMTVRAVLPNPQQTLLPGYFVRVRVPLDTKADTLLVPDSALASDQGGRYVLVVGADDVVEQRSVRIGPLAGPLRVIESGLKADDRVIVGAMLRAVPGQKVTPQTAPAPPPAAKPAAAN